MRKTINIENKEVALDNNVGWALEYRNQFGRDILPVFLPIMVGGIDIAKELLETIGETNEVGVEELLEVAKSDALIDAVVHLSTLELADLINITWAMAKTADGSIPEPGKWVKEFERFPVDVVAPEVVGLMIDGMVSSKNLERLKSRIKTLQPNLSSTILSSRVPNEG